MEGEIIEQKLDDNGKVYSPGLQKMIEMNKRKGNRIKERPWTRNPRDTKPTIKQIKAVQYAAMGMTKTAALRKAGYSHGSVAHGATMFKQKKGFIQAADALEHILKQKVPVNKVADKIAEFIDAKKIISARVTKNGELAGADYRTNDSVEVPDYQTQIKGVELYRDITGKEREGLISKREMSITEFIYGGENEK